MSKKINRVIAASLSAVFVGQVLINGDGNAQGILGPENIARAAELVEEWKSQKELSAEFKQAASELGAVDYFETTDTSASTKSA